MVTAIIGGVGGGGGGGEDRSKGRRYCVVRAVDRWGRDVVGATVSAVESPGLRPVFQGITKDGGYVDALDEFYDPASSAAVLFEVSCPGYRTARGRLVLKTVVANKTQAAYQCVILFPA